MDIKIKASIRAATKTSFDRLWIKYSKYADGTDFISTWEDGYDYIGFAVAYLEPEDKESYNWCRFIQPVDDEFSNESEYPVQNKVITKAVEDIEDSIDVINQNIVGIDSDIEQINSDIDDIHLDISDIEDSIILTNQHLKDYVDSKPTYKGMFDYPPDVNNYNIGDIIANSSNFDGDNDMELEICLPNPLEGNIKTWFRLTGLYVDRR